MYICILYYSEILHKNKPYDSNLIFFCLKARIYLMYYMYLFQNM